MSTRIAINGFGRIGRPTFRRALESEILQVVAINDLVDTKTLTHLLQYDSIYGKYEKQVSYDDNHIIVDGKKIPVYAEADPSHLPWKKLGVDIVLESTGVFRLREAAQKHITAGAKKVILSAPPKGDDVPIYILGANEKTFNPQKDIIISNGSCTTNCLAPVLKVLHDNFKIQNSFATTIHAYTSSQRLVDLPHKDLRRARAASVNIVPTTTGAAKAVCAAIPDLLGKFSASAIRVPVLITSLSDIMCVLEKSTTADDINTAFEVAAKGDLKGILGITYEPLVSSDFIGDSHSAIVDCLLTAMQGSNIVKVVAWYDNEWGYACRYVELAEYIGERI
ncbi:type I glyceraldehyde-3-phosphate dehydrogenase [Patescibacteria group bacterium AH-259-L07]|nr:type I glyceraldehyde-3-phosphate dehydrogenase [Patescibacteria group bacterium AH-259-L07]